MPRKPVGAVGGISPLNLGGMAGALQVPSVRRPTKGSMGGAGPRGAKSRLPPGLQGAAGGKGKPAAKKKSSSGKKKAS